MQERSQTNVGAYGGLGAHGLDFGDTAVKGQGDREKEVGGSFSSSAMRYAPKVADLEDEDEYLVNANLEEELKDELKDIDEQVNSEEAEDEVCTDEAPYPLPDEDEGYLKVL